MNRFVIGTLILCAIVSVAQNAQPLQRHPVVRTGDMPYYPQRPRIARIEGDVRLRVTRDGSAVTSVRLESGQPILAKAAQDKVQTWKFEPRDPTSFATGVFPQLVSYCCDPDVPDNGRVVLKLPTEVDISSHFRVRDGLDPNEGLDLSEPARVSHRV